MTILSDLRKGDFFRFLDASCGAGVFMVTECRQIAGENTWLVYDLKWMRIHARVYAEKARTIGVMTMALIDAPLLRGH